MKKIFFVFLLSVISITSIHGQVIKSVGIKSGFSVANQIWDYKEDESPRRQNIFGGYVAVNLEFLKSKFLNIAVDLSYCNKGCLLIRQRYSGGQRLGDDYNIVKLGYVAISPMLKARYEFSNFIPYVEGGLRMDYETQFRSELSWQMKDRQGIIYGMNFCGGMEYRYLAAGIYIEMQYQNDFTDFIKPSPENSQLEIKNFAYTFAVGYRYYPIKK